jgi:hypothetical protein
MESVSPWLGFEADAGQSVPGVILGIQEEVNIVIKPFSEK